MKYLSLIIVLLSSFLGYIFPVFHSYAQSATYTLTNFITDTTNTLTNEQLIELNSVSSGFQAQTSHEIAALFIANRNGRELYDITLETFRNNGIGTKEYDNGVLLVISTEEKKLRIMVWYGLEWALPDVYLSSLLENKLRPLLNSGNYYELIQTYQQEISATIQSEQYSNQTSWWWDSGSQFIIWFMIGYRLLTILSQAFRSNPLETAFKNPTSFFSIPLLLAWWWASISFGILLGFIGLCIGSLLWSLYRSWWWRSNNGGFYYGGGWFWWGGSFGWGGFGWFGWGSSWGWGAGD